MHYGLELLYKCFINDGLITDGDVLVKMAIEYYNSSGGQIGSTKYFTNDVASGGKATADDVKIVCYILVVELII